jgi:hypothetical protein
MNDASPTQLSLYENARHALAEAKRIDEVKLIRDKAMALQEYGRRAKDKRLIGDAKELQMHAEERAGELLAERKAAGLEAKGTRGAGRPALGGSDRKPPKAQPTLSDLGIDKKLSVRAQKYAKLAKADPAAFKELVEHEVSKAAKIASDGAAPNRTSLTKFEQWFTPGLHVELAREVLGGFDLDPASHPAAQERIRAKQFLTPEDNGLAHEWHGRIWLNPPYTQPAIERFVDKLDAAAHAPKHNYLLPPASPAAPPSGVAVAQEEGGRLEPPANVLMPQALQ